MPHQAPDSIQITISNEGVGAIPPLESVGKIYEIGINGVGYMLSDDPEERDSLPGVIVPNLEAPRLATTDTPFSQAVERYTFETFHDWTAGTNQRWLNREPSTSRAYWDSEGVDPFTEVGELSSLPTVAQSLAETYSDLRVVVVGEDMYAQVSADELKRFTGSTETWGSALTITDGGAITISGLASDGQFWYVATGTSIVRGTTTDPAASWSTVDAVTCKWAAGRICAATKNGSSGTPNRFTSLSDAGVEEVVGGHLELDDGHTVVMGGAAGGHFYFGSYVGDQGLIWAWQLGVDSEGAFHVPFVAWEMPQGVIPTAVHTAGGEVWVRAYRPQGATSGEVDIYRAIPGSGLTPFLVAELGVTDQIGDFDEVGDLVLFSWEDNSGDACLGAVSLVTGGYAKWLLGHETGLVRSVVEWEGREVFTIKGQGVYLRSITAFETTAQLDTSIVDGASLIDKVLDSVTLEVSPILASGSVEVLYTLDGASYVSAGTLSTVGAQRIRFDLDLRSTTFGLRFILTSGGTTVTKMYAAQTQFHPLGLRDLITVLRVKAFDKMTGMNGAPLPDNAVGHGVTIMRTLESFGQSRILLQDIDWHITDNAQVFEVVGVQSTRVSVYDAQRGVKQVGGDVDLTLRKANV